MRKSGFRITAGLVAALVVGGVFTADAAPSSTLTLYVDPAGASSTCSGPGAAACPTIPQAVTVAKTRTNTAVTVSIAPGTYTGLVDIGSVPASDTLLLYGTGGPAVTALDGNGAGTVVSLGGGVASLRGLTIRGGAGGPGGTVDLAGGVQVSAGATMAIVGCVVTDNQSSRSGGGIAVFGYLTVIGSTISDNSASGGGGMYVAGRAVVGTSTISGNDAGALFGGGIYSVGASLAVTLSTVSGNTATQGGGIYSTSLAASITVSTITGNTSTLGFGGNLALTNSSLRGAQPVTTINGSSITAAHPGTNGIGIDASVTFEGVKASFTASVVSDSACALSGNPPPTVVDGGYNVESGNTCHFGATSKVNSSTILISVTPAANGSSGPKTLAIAAASSARDVVPAATCSTTDERGVSRAGPTCDAGAFEYTTNDQPQPPIAADVSLVSDGSTVSKDVVAASQTFGQPATVSIVTPPQHGTATVSGPVVSYTPAAGYGGPDTLTYRLTTAGGTSTGTISIDVQTHALAAPDQSRTYGSDTFPGTTVALYVLGNDDPRGGGALTIAQVSTPAHGTAVRSGSTILYTPAKGFFGTDTFTYSCSNSNGSSNDATVSVLVERFTG